MIHPADTLLDHWNRTWQADPTRPLVIEAAQERAYSRREVAQLAGDAERALPSDLAGRFVLFARPNGVGWLACFLALLRAGAVPVPVDPTEPAARQRELGEAIGAAGVWAAEAFIPQTPRGHRQHGLCLVKLTSGSTGKPKVLRFTDSEMLADGRNVASTMDVRPEDLNLAVVPFGHSYGLGNVVLPLLVDGVAALVPRAPLPRVLAEDCIRWRPTVFPAVPALLRLLLTADVEPASFASWRTVISAGSALPAEVAQLFFERFRLKVHGFYGSSETGGITYDQTGDATLEGRSVGTPLHGVTLIPLRGQRIWIQSAAVFTRGNRRRTPDGFGRHQPSDRAVLSESGELVLLGRAGRLVKVAGRRLDLGELEQLLRSVPGVADAYALSHPHRPDELLAALQTNRTERELRADLGQRLPAWKIPRRLLLLPQFPLTARGKTDTRQLTHALVPVAPSNRV